MVRNHLRILEKEMQSQRAYHLGNKYNSFHERIFEEEFWIPSGHFVVSNRLRKLEDGLNVTSYDKNGKPRTYSNTVALIIGANEFDGPYLVIPNDSEKDTPQIKSERQRLRDLADKF